ncbi:MAG: 3,4-dihydroxy-2-butanone-4-phosphate synthase [Flavobacteriales bacterium]
MNKEELDSIAEAIQDLKAGRVVIVVDDEDRENEGDFVAASHHATPEVINFMSKYGRGLICISLTEERCEELDLNMMVQQNTDPRKTAFTVSVDLLGHGCTTGISAQDRSKTVQALISAQYSPNDFARPGHVFPLKAKNGGVLRRPGHTEAAMDLARMAGLAPSGVLVEIMNDDGSMARLSSLMEIASHFNLKIVSIKDLIAYRLKTETLVERVNEAEIETRFGNFRMIAFREIIEQKEHVALVKGKWLADETIAVRVHSCNILGDIFGTTVHGHSQLLHHAMQRIAERGKGVVVYMNHLQGERSMMDEMQELQNMNEQKEDDSPMADALDYGIGAQILRSLGVGKMQLLTNHPVKRTGLIGYGLEIMGSETIGDCLPLRG